MKYLLGFLLILSVSYSQAQTLRIANNNGGAATGTNVYTGVNALENAIAASASGDIIYVVPSSVGYGGNDINITFPLTIFGVGINPTKDVGLKSIIDVNCFTCAIEVNSSNVRLSGLWIEGEVNLNWVDTQDQTDIVIENCRTERVIMKPSAVFKISNLLIRNSIITGTGSIATHILLKTTANAVITNNIMTEGNNGSNFMLEANGAIFTYNVFSDVADGGLFANITNCFFDHNILYGMRADFNTGSNNSFDYNLCFGNSQDSFHVFDIIANGNTGTGNIESVAGSNDPLFTNFPQVQFWDNESYDLTLQAGSAALNINGENIGTTGGPTPFDAEGNLLPLIQSITVPAVIPVGTDLPVNIKAKGN